MSSPRRLAAAAAFLLAMSVFAVPACEVDSSTRPHGGRPDVAKVEPVPVPPVG